MSLIAQSELDFEKHERKIQKARAKASKYYQNHRAAIMARRAYRCFCGLTYTGTGPWKRAKAHCEYTGHKIVQGTPVGKYRVMAWGEGTPN